MDEQVPLEEIHCAGHGNSSSAEVVLTNQRYATGQVDVLAQGIGIQEIDQPPI